MSANNQQLQKLKTRPDTKDDKFKYLDEEAILGTTLPISSPPVIDINDAPDRFCARKPFKLIDTSKFKDIDDFKRRAEGYFDSVDELNKELEAKWYANSTTKSRPFRRKPYILQGLALALGFNSMREFNDFKTIADIKRFPNSKYKDYYSLLNRCILLIEGTLQSGAISEDYNNKAVENYSRNNLGYSDKAMGMAGENHMREIKINIVTLNSREDVEKYELSGGNSEELKKKGIAIIQPVDADSGEVIECEDATKLIEENNNNDNNTGK